MTLETISWITPSGTTVAFDGTAGLRLIEGPANRFAPPVELILDETTGHDGVTIRDTKYRPRTIELQIGVEGTSAAQCRTRLRSLMQSTAADRGAGLLRFVTPDGDTREIGCVYNGGFEGDDTLADPALTEFPFSVQFFAPDPLFRAATDTLAGPWTTSTGIPFFPILPLRLSSSSVFASATIDNTGDVDTDPIWTIIGPGHDLAITHVLTGRKISWSGTLATGEVLTIDTRDSAHSTTPKSVLLQNGDDVFTSLNAWDFWPLTVGAQTVQIELAGATAASSVSARWRTKYYGA